MNQETPKFETQESSEPLKTPTFKSREFGVPTHAVYFAADDGRAVNVYKGDGVIQIIAGHGDIRNDLTITAEAANCILAALLALCDQSQLIPVAVVISYDDSK